MASEGTRRFSSSCTAPLVSVSLATWSNALRSGTAMEASRIRIIKTRQRSCPPVANIRATGPCERIRASDSSPRDAQHRLLNFRSAHSDQEEDQERARHDGDQVGQEKKTGSTHDFQVQAAAQTEAHRAERRHQCYRDGNSGQVRSRHRPLRGKPRPNPPNRTTTQSPNRADWDSCERRFQPWRNETAAAKPRNPEKAMDTVTLARRLSTALIPR